MTLYTALQMTNCVDDYTFLGNYIQSGEQF